MSNAEIQASLPNCREVLSVVPMMAFGPGHYFVTWLHEDGTTRKTYIHP